MNKDMGIKGGVYLVLDPSLEKLLLLTKLEQALQGGVQLMQIWDNWPASFQLTDKHKLIEAIGVVASRYGVPVLINEEWELLKNNALSGIHFDRIPANYKTRQSEISRNFIAGITCSNDLSVVEWAEEHQLDYISFCSMFPSNSVDSCEIVLPETIKKTRKITNIPIFLSGGITIDNMMELKELDFAGVAVISGILSSDTPKESSRAYTNVLNQLKS